MADATGVHQYSGSAVQSALSAGISNSATTFSITPTTNWPDGSIGNFVATADPNTSLEEKMLCSGLAGGVLTVVTRGYDGTSAVAHASGAVIIHTVSAIDLAEANWIANFHARTSKATPVDADEIPLADSAATFGLKKLTWANIKATLLTYFNTKFSRASFRTQATANSTLTLTVSDNEIQEFTGTTAGQIVQEADVTTLFIGYKRRISNKSTQSIAVNSSGGNLIYTVPAGTDWLFTCNAITGTTAASWSNSYVGASAAPVDNTAWTAYTPTVTSSVGTFTTVTPTGRYKLIGKLCTVAVAVGINSVGTAAGTMYVTLPFTAASSLTAFVGVSYNVNAPSSGSAIIYLDLTKMAILKYDGNTQIMGSQTVVAEITYEVA